MDACLLSVPLALPSRDFGRDLLLAVQPSIQALPIHDPDLRLRHVYPTAVLGRVVPLDLVQQPACFRWRKRLVQARASSCVFRLSCTSRIFLALGVMHVHQFPHTQGVVLAGTPRAHPDVSPAAQGSHISNWWQTPLRLVLVVHLSDRAGGAAFAPRRTVACTPRRSRPPGTSDRRAVGKSGSRLPCAQT